MLNETEESAYFREIFAVIFTVQYTWSFGGAPFDENSRVFEVLRAINKGKRIGI